MKIYRVEFAANDFQSLFPEEDSLWATGMLTLDGTSRMKSWKCPKLYSLYPKLQRGDFFGGNVGGLIASPEATKKVSGFFHRAGELLPVDVEDEAEPFTLLNVTECINALDKERTEWFLDPKTGQKVAILKYAFHSNRMVESTLFKIPETCRGEVLTFERCGHPEDEFKAFVEANGLKGLVFKELWAEGEPLRNARW